MVQKEVADRLAAHPGTEDYGLLTATAQLYSRVEILFAVPPAAFSPPPKVQSAVVRLDIMPRLEKLDVNEAEFMRFPETFLRAETQDTLEQSQGAVFGGRPHRRNEEGKDRTVDAGGGFVAGTDRGDLFRELDREITRREVPARLKETVMASVREPAVAGRFYPGDAAKLRADVESYLSPPAGTGARDRVHRAPRRIYLFGTRCRSSVLTHQDSVVVHCSLP